MVDLKNTSLVKQMLCSFGSLAFGSLLAILLIMMGYLSILNSNLKDLAEGALIDQSTASIEVAASENFDVLKAIMVKAEQGFLNVYTTAAMDTFRSEYRLRVVVCVCVFTFLSP